MAKHTDKSRLEVHILFDHHKKFRVITRDDFQNDTSGPFY